jgi:hypothetical protein
MVREELFSLCEEYVRGRDEAVERAGPADAPTSEILRSFTLAEISESEMEALLAYVGDSDAEDDCLAANAVIDRYDEPGAVGWQDDDV